MRFFIFGNNAWSYSQMRSVRHVGKAGILKPSEHLDILWELKANLDTQYKLHPFKTNSQGLRDIEYSLLKPPNTFRIAVIGDSLTMAEGVAIENAYHTILENRLNESENKSNPNIAKYEFINFGVAGYSLVQYLSTIKRKALAYKPDAILIGFCGANDSKLPNLEAFKTPYKVKAEGNGFYHFYSLELLGNVYKKYYKQLRGRFPGYNADPNYVAQKFKELSEISIQNKVPIIIGYIDNKSSSKDLPLIRDLAYKNGFTFINATTSFPKEVLPENMIYLTDGHPNAAANKILANSLFEGLYSKIQTLR